MIPVALNDDGPDMDAVRELVKDPAVKGMWLVPTYGNPTGSVVSEAVAAELAAMETAAPDFRIFWDNAYAVHHLTEQQTKTADILGLCAASGHPNRPVIFASTSKITFAGAGRLVPGRLGRTTSRGTSRTWPSARSGPDKVNQLRHARFLADDRGRARADGPAPRDPGAEVRGGRADPARPARRRTASPSWTEPKGGYFVSLDVVDGTASRVVELTREAGVAMTPAGAAFPYGEDPRDRNIRIAPSYPVAGRAGRRDRRARDLRPDRRRRASPRPEPHAGAGGAGRVRRHADRARGGPRDHRGLAAARARRRPDPGARWPTADRDSSTCCTPPLGGELVGRDGPRPARRRRARSRCCTSATRPTSRAPRPAGCTS